MGVRYCTEEDFGRTENLKERFIVFRDFAQAGFLCPQNNDIRFKGSFQTLQAKFMTISVYKCNENNKLVDKCANAEEIDKYVDTHSLL